MVVYFRCGKIGHYSIDCHNPRKQKGYLPMCGNCCQCKHAIHECNKTKPNFLTSQRDWIKGRQAQYKEEDETRNVNHINLQSPIHVVSTQVIKAKQQQLDKTLDFDGSDP